MEDVNLLRVRRSVYNSLIEKAKDIHSGQFKKSKDAFYDLFPSRNNYPTVSVLKESRPEKNLRKYLPYLVYYKEVYSAELDEVIALKEYLSEMFEEYIEFIPDEAYEKIENCTSAAWKSKSVEDRADLLDDIIAYYGFNEFDEFIKDLVHLPFMRNYGVVKKGFNSKLFPKEMISDLKDVWDFAQGI